MKITQHIFVFFIMKILTLGAETDLEIQARWKKEAKEFEGEQIQAWENNFTASKKMKPAEKLDFLWLGLRNMGARMLDENRNPGVDAIYHKIQKSLLEIPNHAQYFADHIEELRVEYYKPNGSSDYDNARVWELRDTLKHLPSPETVRVLGHYLSDERDPPPAFLNSYLSAQAISMIGLNDPPILPRALVREKELAAARAWWEQVAAGERSFSFVRQNLSYRFKPDGSVESSPRDGSRDQDPPPAIWPGTTSAHPPPANSNPWPRAAITASVAVLIGLVFRFLRKMKEKHA